jgi:outer membrane autotransporter protein
MISAAGEDFETERASYDGDFVLPSLKAGVLIPLGLGAVFVPSAEVRYIYQHLDGYTETGGTANLTVGARDMHALEERLELALHQTLDAGGTPVSWHAAAGLSLYQRIGGHDVTVGVFGNALTFDPGAEDNETSAFARAGFDASLTSSLNLFGEAEAQHGEDWDAVSGFGGVRLKF